MSIFLYSGTPGSGKSLHMASVCISRLNYCGPVIGTFKINESLLKKNHYDYFYKNIYDLDPHWLADFSKEYFRTHKFKEGHIYLLIDECQRIFNPRSWNSKEGIPRNDWVTFFAEHRHMGYDVILVSQMDLMLDKQIRGLIEYGIVHRKASNFHWIFKLLFPSGNLFVSVKTWYPIKEKVSSEFFLGRKKLYSFYDSYADLGIREENTSPEEVDSSIDSDFLDYIEF